MERIENSLYKEYNGLKEDPEQIEDHIDFEERMIILIIHILHVRYYKYKKEKQEGMTIKLKKDIKDTLDDIEKGSFQKEYIDEFLALHKKFNALLNTTFIRSN
jgi:hypothetical protein